MLEDQAISLITTYNFINWVTHEIIQKMNSEKKLLQWLGSYEKYWGLFWELLNNFYVNIIEPETLTLFKNATEFLKAFMKQNFSKPATLLN